MISIVTAYINRKQLLINTLQSLNKSEIKDFEFIVVDDCSSDEHKIDDLCGEYPFLRVIRVESSQKWYVNPCIPFNIGFKEAKGNIVIIQNPECYHYDDILSYVYKNLKEDDYFSFGCYSLSKESTENLNQVLNTDFIIDRPVSEDIVGDEGWYNHSFYRPVGYHFCSAIYKSQLDNLGGFDERYAYGISWDDNEILERIKRKGLNINIVDDKKVLHQWHGSVNYNLTNHIELGKINRELFHSITLNENGYKANDKINYKKIYNSAFENNYYNQHPSEEFRFQYVLEFVKNNNINNLIDVGSGRGKLIEVIKTYDSSIDITSCDLTKYHNYDVNFIEMDLTDEETFELINKEEFDLLTCLDVMEHIEKKYVNNIIQNFSRISNYAVLSIANHSDILNGVELHLIQEDMSFWKPLLENYFKIIDHTEFYNGRLHLLILKSLKK